ncbi:hypothetical protein [Citrobacter phage Ci1]|nr:hypothetical protein [Citrobacter phage Ci1]
MFPIRQLEIKASRNSHRERANLKLIRQDEHERSAGFVHFPIPSSNEGRRDSNSRSHKAADLSSVGCSSHPL